MPKFKDAPAMSVLMSTDNAYRSGYVHGYQDVVTNGICILYHGTAARAAWMKGYNDGAQDRKTA